jgi:N-acetylmuramoyl-L-alanine amidase
MYVPLVVLCNVNGIDLDYDTYARTVTLRKNAHRINLRLGDTLVLVDGAAEHLKDPVDIYNGAVVVPHHFKDTIVDVLCKATRASFRRPFAALEIKKIIIDAGHGGNDPGAIGKSGLKEKDVNLDVAKRLVKLLRERGLNVVMTRSNDTFISLARRVEIANRADADFFISIHSNANRVRSLKGFEVYYISPRANDTRRALQAVQSAVLDIDRGCFASASPTLKAILWDMIYTYSRAESIELAKSICRNIDRDLDLRVLGIKGANFYVLKGVHIPAVLIEIGFLSNGEEERLLRSGYYRQQISEAIMQGIEDYAAEYTLAMGG